MLSIVWTGNNLSEIVACLGDSLRCTELVPMGFDLIVTTRVNKARVSIGQTLQYNRNGYVCLGT